MTSTSVVFLRYPGIQLIARICRNLAVFSIGVDFNFGPQCGGGRGGDEGEEGEGSGGGDGEADDGGGGDEDARAASGAT